MDKHRAHDIVHQWNGGKAENCPKCTGDMTNEEMMDAANEISSSNFQPKVNPMLPYEKRMMQYAELNAKSRKDLADSDFAYIDSKGEKHLPINDAAHVRNALARFNETDFESTSAKSSAMEKIKAKAKELGVAVDAKMGEDDSATDAGQETLTIRPLIDILSFAESVSDIPAMIKLIPVGKYKMQRYGDVDLTADKLAEMVQHFNEGIRAGGKKAGLPIDIEHGTTQYKDAAAGWIKDMELKEDGVYGKVDWTTLGKKLLKERIYKFYSPEFHFKYTDPQHSFELNNVMTGGGLVNKPMIKDDLPAIVNSEKGETQHLTKDQNASTLYLELQNNSKSMKLSEILVKAKTDRTTEEEKFVVEHKDELTLAEARKEGLLPKEVKSTDGMVVLSEEKLNSLTALAEQGRIANEKLQRAELKEKVKELVFSEEGAKMPTDQVEAAVDLAMEMSETSREKYFAQLKALPVSVTMKEVGTTAAVKEGSAIGGDLKKKAEELASTQKIAFGEALKRVIRDNPDQYKEYSENLPVAQQEK